MRVKPRANAKRVLLIGNFLSDAGQSRKYIEDLDEKLRARGWATVTASSQTGRVARLFDMIKVCLKRRNEYDVSCVDVFSGPSFFWAEVLCLVLRRLRKPYIITLRGGNLPAFAQRWPVRVNRLLNGADAVTTPSTLIKEDLSCFRRDIIYLPNALELDEYKFRLRSVPSPHLYWLRAFRYIYNPTIAVEVLALLKEDFPQMELTMIGPDSGDGTLQAVQRLSSRLDVGGRVNITGLIPKKEVPPRLGVGDIFLNTTRYESFGVSVMEAAALGMCIVTTNAGELPYLWTDGDDALLVSVNDAPAMSKAVRRILTEPGLAQQLSQNARRKAEQFDWDTVLPQWERLLGSVMNQGRL